MSLEVTALRAMAHPVRLRMLSLLTGVEMSAAEVARELGLTQANASYHLRVLAASGYLTEAGTEKIRGGVAKRYTHPWRPADRPGAEKAEAAGTGQRAVVEAVAAELVRRSAAQSGRHGHITDAELWVRPEVWKEVRRLVEEASTTLHESARRPRTKGTVHVNMTAVMFEMKAGR